MTRINRVEDFSKSQADMIVKCDATFKQLVDEFYKHKEKVRKENGNAYDDRTIFEAWTIQKLANLQTLALEQERRHELHLTLYHAT